MESDLNRTFRLIVRKGQGLNELLKMSGLCSPKIIQFYWLIKVFDILIKNKSKVKKKCMDELFTIK